MRYLVLILLLASPMVKSGEIAITFDDAPTSSSAILTGKERTERIIRSLKAAKVPDTLFFVTTKNIREHGTERLSQYVQSGYHLANHSHQHLSANQVSVDTFMMDVYRAHLALKSFDGVLPYFRFPYLHYGNSDESINALQSYLAELGYIQGYVTIDNFDWYINSVMVNAKKAGKEIDYERLGDVYVSIIWQCIEFYDDIATRQLGRSPKHILLLHENDTSALFLSKLVRHIRKNDWKIITPQEAYTDPIARKLPSGLFHKQGRIAAIAHANGIPINALRHKSENQEYLDDLLARQKVFMP